MEDLSVLVIGCGAAGLAAAHALAEQRIPVTILEARDRAGGRIRTVSSRVNQTPIELGAEFIHGKRNRTWDFIRKANLDTHEVPDRHWLPKNGSLTEECQFWQELEQVMAKINSSHADADFDSFLAKARGVKNEAAWLAREYVEGFNAAAAARISMEGLAKSQAASERSEGTHQFRLSQGYCGLVQWFVKQLGMAHVPIYYNMKVEELLWEVGKVEARAQTAMGPKKFSASRALITIPLGVLKERTHRGITFDPRLTRKKRAISGLAMGDVMKVTLQFHSRFWPVENFGFIHSKEKWLPTWWGDERGAILTGWAGGPRATELNGEHPNSIVAEALRALRRIFKLDQHQIEELLATSYVHNWINDPLSQGAYTFIPVGMINMPSELAEPIKGTLFFAGEATDTNGDQGTVQGALTSGERAAKEIVEAMHPSHAGAVD